MKSILIAVCALILLFKYADAQNPLIRNQFSADPSARVFGNTVFLYPSHDILASPGHGRAGWFCMEDYHVFSSDNLTQWKDHGVIVSQYKVNWADSTAYAMWAPDCILRNGKYYFYFPAQVNAKYGKGFGIGVAIASKPDGPFIPQQEPITGVHGIDPNVFIDGDGLVYLYWAQSSSIYAAKLNADMLSLASEPLLLANLPDKGLKEGPYLFKRKNRYYLTYPHVADKTERLEYAVAGNPLGPFKFSGVIMDESESGCWTNHQSIIVFKGQWYLFYHNDDLSPAFDKARSVRADSLFFNNDGTIRKVIPTLRGVGVTNATDKIQPDRYSAISKTGTAIAFIDTAKRMDGWQTIFNNKGAWVRYNAVNFGYKSPGHIKVMYKSAQDAQFEIRLDKLNGLLLGVARVKKGETWQPNLSKLKTAATGRHDLFIILKTPDPAAVDWIQFN